MPPSTWRPETLAIHTGVYQDKTFNSVTTPIYPTSTFQFERVGVTKGYDYTRTANPTRTALQENLAALEGGDAAWATATGMAAMTCALMLFKAGDHIVTGHDIYGGTYRLLATVAPRMGIEVSFVNMRELEAVTGAIKKNTRALLIETPTNPLLNIMDIGALASIGRERGLIAIVDNTFLTPLVQRPLDLGADVVVHSTTKYLNGHSDVVGGAVIVRGAALAEEVKFLVNALGLGQSPFDCWLVLRGLKTLVQRMEAHQRNAMAVAKFLEGHPSIRKVYFPGLETHPDHELAKKQQKGFGGIVSFELDTNRVSPDTLFSRLQLFLLAESLGGVESLIDQPWTMTHVSMDEQARAAAGLSPSTIRLSIGIEHPDDLIDDLRQGLEG
jgi:O-succinylhomoserine (thiol)-lyase